jgi:hypothetical protein
MSLRKLPPGAPGALRIGVIKAFQEMGHPAQLVFRRPHAQSRVALEDTGENQMPMRPAPSDPHSPGETGAAAVILGGVPGNSRFVAMCKLKGISRSWAAPQKGS